MWIFVCLFVYELSPDSLTQSLLMLRSVEVMFSGGENGRGTAFAKVKASSWHCHGTVAHDDSCLCFTLIG